MNDTPGMYGLSTNLEIFATLQQVALLGCLRDMQELQHKGIDLYNFSPCPLFKSLQGRTLWLIGDSQMGRISTSLQCFLSVFSPDVRLSLPFGGSLEKSDLLRNTGKAPLQPICLNLIADTRICYLRIDRGPHLWNRYLPALLEHGDAKPDDVILANFGVHYGWQEEQAYKADLATFASYAAQNRARLPKVMWLETMPQHFERHYFTGHGAMQNVNASNGCWPSSADNTVSFDESGLYNAAANSVMQGMGMPVVRIWKDLVGLHAFHQKSDCTHFCFPGANEIVVYRFAAQLLMMNSSDYTKMGSGITV